MTSRDDAAMLDMVRRGSQENRPRVGNRWPIKRRYLLES